MIDLLNLLITFKLRCQIFGAQAINSTDIELFIYFFVAFDKRIPNIPSETCDNAYSLWKTRFCEKLKIFLNIR